MPRLDRLWYVIDAETKGFDEGIIKSGEKLRSFVDYAKGNPLVVLGALSAALIVVGERAASAAAHFDKSMRQIQTVTVAVDGTMEDLRNGVLKTFETLPIASLDDLTKGLYDIISSGVPAGEAIEYLNVASRAAVGGVTSVSVAVDGLTTATNAWKNQGLTVTDAADQMFQAVNKGKMTFEQLASSMGSVAGMAAGLGIPMKDVLAITAQLTLSGYSSAESMTAIRSAITNIIKPTGELAKLYPDLARQFTRSRLEGDGLVKFLTDFQVATKGNGAAITALFTDVQALSGVMALLKDGGVGVTQMLKDVANSAGAAKTASDLVGGSAEDTAQVLKNRLSAEFTRMGTLVLPVWIDAIKLATAALRIYNGEAAKSQNVKIITDVGAGASDTSAAGVVAQNAKVREAFDLVRDGAVDVTRLTEEQLKGLHAAFAANLAQEANLSVQDFEKMRTLAQSLPSYHAPSQRAAALDLVSQEEARRAAAAQAAATSEATQNARRIEGLKTTGSLLVENTARAIADARAFKGFGDEQERAMMARRGALAQLDDAEKSRAAAARELAAATAKGDVNAANAAIAKLTNVNTQIAQTREAMAQSGQQLTQAARQAAEAKAEILKTASEYARGGAKDTVAEAEEKIDALVRKAKTAHVELAGLDGAALAQAKATIRAGAALVAERNASATMDQITSAGLAAAGDALEQTRHASDVMIRGLEEQVRLDKDLSASQREDAKRWIEKIRLAEQYKAVLTGVGVNLAAIDLTDAENDLQSRRRALGNDKRGVGLADRETDPRETQDAALLLAYESQRATVIGHIADLAAKGTRETDPAMLAARKQLLDINGKILTVEERARQTELARRAAIVAHLQAQARALQESVQMATQLAQAFGLMDANTASMLGSLTQVASSIAPLLDGIKDMQKVGGTTSLADVIGLAGPLVGGIASLASMMGDHEDPAIRKAREDNTIALRELTKKVGDLSKADVSGTDLATVSGALAPALTEWVHALDAMLKLDPVKAKKAQELQAGAKIDDNRGAIDALLAKHGSSLADVEKVAKALGLTLVTVADLGKVLDAMGKADLAGYTDSFAGAMERLQDSLRAYGITDPTEKLRRTIVALTSPKTGIPALAAALAGIDATSAGGATDAITKLQALLDALGAGTLSAADLGGASIDETRQAILDLIDQLRGNGSATGTGGYNVSQSITETTGNHLEGLLVTGNAFAERTALAVEALLRGAGGAVTSGGAVLPPIPTSPPSVLPPAPIIPYPGSGGAGGGASAAASDGGLTIERVEVNVNFAPGDGPTTPGGAQAISDATVLAVGRGMQTAIRRKAFANGEVAL